jgi:hypothetical protein
MQIESMPPAVPAVLPAALPYADRVDAAGRANSIARGHAPCIEAILQKV